MAPHPTTLDDIDLWDLDLFEWGDPHRVFGMLRDEAPVWWHDRPGGEPFWAVTRYDDGRAILIDTDRFSSADGIMLRSAVDLSRESPGATMGIQPMIHIDPPRHQAVRKLVAPRFTPRSVAELRAQVEEITARCLDDAAERGEVDFVTDVAHRIPAAITLSLLGVADEHADRLAELEHLAVTNSDPEFTGGRDRKEAADAASRELNAFLAGLVQARLAEPGDDLISEFVRGRIDGDPLRWEQITAEAGLLLAGGLDTTRAAASAGAMLPLLEHPDQLARLQADPALVPTAVEEFIRWASPVMSETRTATVDLDLHGQPVRAGDRVVVWTASCNRDPAAFDHPERYDVGRQPNRHLAFAYGEHFCLGAHLARLILVVEFTALLQRFRSFELVGEPSRVRSNFLGGLKHLPVRLTSR